MTRFFKYLLYFITPIILLWLTELVVYETSGDLGRLGKIPISKSYRKRFSEALQNIKYFKELSDQISAKSKKTRVLVCGDSFSSGQGIDGYVNILASNNNLEVVLFDEYLRSELGRNPIQNLSNLLKGGFFDSLEFDYVILQNVERSVVQRAGKRADSSAVCPTRIKSISNAKTKSGNQVTFNYQDTLIDELNDFVLFYQYSLGYLFDDNAFYSDVYKIPIDSGLFSNEGDLLVYKHDLELTEKFIKPKIAAMNNRLNDLSRKLAYKNVTLISLISPDKFDFYYDSLKNVKAYPKPIFFETYATLEKHYRFIDSYKILKEASKNGVRDLYYYDDSHWSIIGHKIIAEDIRKQLYELSLARADMQ